MQGEYGMDLPLSLDTVDGTAVKGEDFQLNTTSVTFTLRTMSGTSKYPSSTTTNSKAAPPGPSS